MTAKTDAFQISHKGIAFFGEMDQHEWEALGSKLGQLGRSVQWLIGDWINYGEGRGQRYYGATTDASGEKPSVYTHAMRLTGLDYGTLANYASVSRKVDFSLRSENLSFDHHRKVASLKDPEEQKKWIKTAEAAAKKGAPISSRRLAKSIIVGRVVNEEEMTTPPAERGQDNANVHVNRLVTWLRKAKNSGWLDRAEECQLRALLIDLKPVMDIAIEIRGKLDEFEAEEADEE